MRRRWREIFIQFILKDRVLVLGGIIKKSKFHLSYWFGGCCYTSWLHFFSTQLFAYSLLVGSRFLTYLGWDSIKHPLFNGFAAKSVRRRARSYLERRTSSFIKMLSSFRVAEQRCMSPDDNSRLVCAEKAFRHNYNCVPFLLFMFFARRL